MVIFRILDMQISEHHAARCERVIARNAPLLGERYEAGGDLAADVLRDLFPQIAVQWLRATIESSADVRSIKRSQLEERKGRKGRVGHSARRSFLRRAKARSKASVCGAGNPIATAYDLSKLREIQRPGFGMP